MMKISDLLNLHKPLVLASASPRRKKLLEQLGFEFEIMTANIDENDMPLDTNPADYAMRLAKMKAQDVAYELKYPAVVLGADTIVVLDGKILNKPDDPEHAKQMLRTLSNNTHTVYTGIAVVESISDRQSVKVQKTDVTFRELGNEEIDAYVASGSPMDKAGAYGIQNDFGSVFVSHINGCYYNIVGLPLELLYKTLAEFLKESR